MSNRTEQKALKETSQLLRGFATHSGGGATRMGGGPVNKQMGKKDCIEVPIPSCEGFQAPPESQT